MEITGKVLRVFYSGDSFSSVLLDGVDGTALLNAGLSPGPVKAADVIISPVEGITLKLSGDWNNHEKFGMQFKAISSEAVVGGTLPSIKAYLSSGCIKGIGPKLAVEIVRVFGTKTIEIIEDHPEQLQKVAGISSKRAAKIAESYQSSHVFMQLYDYFQGGVTEHQVKTIYEKYGGNSVKMLKENPYRLIYDLDGFGFIRTDALAKSGGITAEDPRRTRAAIIYALKTIAQDGHCFCMLDSLEGILSELIPDGINLSNIAECLLSEQRGKHIVIEKEAVYLSTLYEAEIGLANYVNKQIREGPAKEVSSSSLERAVAETEKRLGFPLETRQKDAVRYALRNGVSVITGGPGTGKTTIIQAVIRAWGDPRSVLLAAPTGRASRRMAEVTGLPAKTIHRWLDEGMKSGRGFERRLVIVDESSMLDLELAFRFAGLLKQCTVVFIGDVDQLPPIGPGNFFRDLVTSPKIPKVVLEMSHRQSGNIAKNAQKINSGEGAHALVQDDSFHFLPSGKETVQEDVIQEYCRMVHKFGLENTQCIVPIRKENRSVTATERLNPMIRDILNPITEAMKCQLIPGLDFRPGDRVMQTVNDKDSETFNGDCGVIQRIEQESKTVVIRMDDGRETEFSFGEMRSFCLSYAITCHKSQGSEYRGIVVACSMEHCFILQRNLLYTAVTRAKDEVSLIGEARAVTMAVRKVPAMIRNTRLKQRI